MQYTLLFYLSPGEFSARSDPKQQHLLGSFVPYAKASGRGSGRGGAGLQPPEAATTVRLH
jgi:hypothetical protein